MQNEKVQSKMYLEIVRELRTLIQQENIRTGGKLPSERELAERMQVGRSTIREALRSLELLGIIETRRGEGTFLADFQKNQFVEVLSGFILQQPTSMEELQETKEMIEHVAIQKVAQSDELNQLAVWNGFLNKLDAGEKIQRNDLAKELIVHSGNRLMLKIWMLLTQYANEETHALVIQNREVAKKFLQALIAGESIQALHYHSEWSTEVLVERGEN